MEVFLEVPGSAWIDRPSVDAVAGDDRFRPEGHAMEGNVMLRELPQDKQENGWKLLASERWVVNGVKTNSSRH